MRRPALPEISLATTVAAGVPLLLAAIWYPPTAAQAWLAAYLFWIGLPVGALFAILVHGLTGGDWGLTLRPATAAMVRTTPLLALFLIPVLIWPQQIYPWADGTSYGWLDLPFFAARAVLYIALWNAIAFGVERWRQPDGRLPPGLAWPALIVLFATTTLAAFDWVMTLEPRWTSTIFGLLITAGWVLSAIAVATAIVIRLGTTGEELDTLARIMLALIMLWAYASAVQLIVIWESDLAGEINWYLRRGASVWFVAVLLVLSAEFGVPFLILLWRPLRRSPAAVFAAAVLVMAAHLGETWWLTVPDFSRPFSWAEPLAIAAIGGCVLFVVGRQLSSATPLP
ncbi:MAG: hypothetical protein ACJ8AH_14815 [Stellaceae bacterium]